jgi:hypothetical protein
MAFSWLMVKRFWRSQFWRIKMWGVRSPVVSGPRITFPESSQGKFLNVVRRPIMAFSWLMVKRFWRSQFWRMKMWGGAIARRE